MAIHIANAAGFLGDDIAAPRRLIEAAQVDYLTLEYLAELTLSILARLREKDPQKGYAGDFLKVLTDCCPALSQQEQLKIVTNAGGMNPQSCAKEAGRILSEAELGDQLLGVVQGDNLLPRLDEIQKAGCSLAHCDTGQPLAELDTEIVSANTYLGAQPIAAALNDGSRFVITGRVADASLTVGPAVHHFNWQWDDWQRLAAASVAGHIIECGAQATGGYTTDWARYDLADVGYPIAKLQENGACTITKSANSGGAVTRQHVIEQLVYEIGDPRHYLTPDVDVDFTTVEVQQEGSDQVAVRGASGNPAPDTYKVSLAYRNGYTASGQLLVYGADCLEKGKICAEIIRRRLEADGAAPQYFYYELLGIGDGVPGCVDEQSRDCPREVMLRVAVRDDSREKVQCFTRQIAPLVTSGPAGLAGYAVGRSPVRPVFAYWPALIPKSMIEPTVDVRPAQDWRKD